MPDIRIGGIRLHYDIHGDGPETIVFVHGLMLASESWEAQVAHFSARYRVVTFDLRGQGRSDKVRAGLDLDNLAVDAVELMRTLNLAPCHLVGFSMGTFVAMRVAARRPELIRTLTLIGPSAEAEEPANLPRYRLLIALVTLFGPAPFTGPLMKILFGDTFLADRTRRAEADRWRGYLRRLPRSLARAAAASAARRGIEPELARIRAPTLIVSGEEDRPISPTRARAVHAAIAGSRFVAVPATGHAVMIEQAARFNALLEDWLTVGRD